MTESIFCSYQNQAGFLCGKCAKGNGLARTGKDYYLQVIGFFSLMTVFFVLVVILHLNFASGPLLGHIAFSQLFVTLIRSNVGFYDSVHASLTPFGKIALTTSLGTSVMWWYFSTVLFDFPKAWSTSGNVLTSALQNCERIAVLMTL